MLAFVLLVNLEWIRAVRGILQNLTAVVGGPVAWTVPSFPAHALGLRASVWEGGRLDQRAALAREADRRWRWRWQLWLAVMAASQNPARWRHWRRPPTLLARWRGPALVPALTWLGLSVLLFMYFRYVVPSPWHGRYDLDWPDGVGQSWSQYKLTTWGSFAAVGVVAASITGVTMARRMWRGWRVGMAAVLALWCGTGLGWNRELIQRRGEWISQATGIRYDPLKACWAMRQEIAKLPPGDWIYLDWPPGGEMRKYRELMVYLLNDHPLASDWRDDGYLWPYVPPEDARRTPADCAWILKYRPPPKDGSVPTLGGMTLERSSGHPAL